MSKIFFISLLSALLFSSCTITCVEPASCMADASDVIGWTNDLDPELEVFTISQSGNFYFVANMDFALWCGFLENPADMYLIFDCEGKVIDDMDARTFNELSENFVSIYDYTEEKASQENQ